MKQCINVLTLGVNNLEHSMKFYQDGFGWKTKDIIGIEFENGAVVFLALTMEWNYHSMKEKI